MMIIYNDNIYNDNTSWYYIMIICDDHIWWSYMMIIYDDHLGVIWESSGGHLGDIWESSGSHLGVIWETFGSQDHPPNGDDLPHISSKSSPLRHGYVIIDFRWAPPLERTLLNAILPHTLIKGGVSARNLRKVYFPEMCWPGGQIIPTPRGSILHPARASQVPYRAIFVFVGFSEIRLYISLLAL